MTQTPAENIRKWVETHGQVPNNFDPKTLKRIVDKVLKGHKLTYNGSRVYTLQKLPFNPKFKHESIGGAPPSLPKKVPRPPKKRARKNNVQSEKSTVVEQASPSLPIYKPKNKRKASSSSAGSKKKKRKPNSAKPQKEKRDALNIDWNQDAKSIADQMYQKGWRIKTVEICGRKIHHFVP